MFCYSCGKAGHTGLRKMNIVNVKVGVLFVCFSLLLFLLLTCKGRSQVGPGKMTIININAEYCLFVFHFSCFDIDF